jgi:polar amino acid transport system permease protein
MTAWDTDYALDVFPQIFEAFLRYTLVVTALASALAAVLGLVLAIVRRGHVPVLAPLTTAFIEFIRGTPVPIQLFFVFYVVPGLGLTLSGLAVGVLVLGVHYACYYSEVYRAGIDAVPKGQWEACTALSMPRRYQWQRVVLPQAIRNVLPSLGNYVISMFKETPFLFLIAVPEMVQEAIAIGGRDFRYLEPLTIAGIIFLAASYPSAVAMRKLEKRLGHA